MENPTVTISLENLVKASGLVENPTLFMNIVLGTYSEPDSFKTAIINKKICSFVSYNPLTDNVVYSFVEFKYYNKDHSDYKFSPSEEYFSAEFYKIRTEYTSLLTWNHYGQLLSDMQDLKNDCDLNALESASF